MAPDLFGIGIMAIATRMKWSRRGFPGLRESEDPGWDP